MGVIQYFKKKWEENKARRGQRKKLTWKEQQAKTKEWMDKTWLGHLQSQDQKSRKEAKEKATTVEEEEEVKADNEQPRHKTWKTIWKEEAAKVSAKRAEKEKEEAAREKAAREKAEEKSKKPPTAIEKCFALPLSLFVGSLGVFLVCCLLILIPIIGLLAAPIAVIACLGILASPFILLFNLLSLLLGKKVTLDVGLEQYLSRMCEVPVEEKKEEEKANPSFAPEETIVDLGQGNKVPFTKLPKSLREQIIKQYEEENPEPE